MKGYLFLLLLTGGLLLLFPLAALPQEQPAVTPPAESSTLPTEDIPPADSPVSDSTAETDLGSFNLLCGEEVVPLSVREFLIRTLAAEMSPSYHIEALKAQAVAAYTYYGRRRTAQMENPDAALKGAHFITPLEGFPENYTKEALQARWGEQFALYYDKICQAVEAVAGRAMTYNGQYIDACYFSISNGHTESAETVWGTDIPYLQTVASPGDRLAPGYTSTVTRAPDEVRAALPDSVSLPDDPATWFGEPVLSAAGTVDSQTVGDKTFTGAELRAAFGLRSATFTVAYTAQAKAFTFAVSGYGHGVGMSQYGADYLARQGYSWQEILQHYYTGVTIV